MSSIIQALADHFSVDALLEQNDIPAKKVIEWLVDEGLLDLEDYIFEDMEVGDYD